MDRQRIGLWGTVIFASLAAIGMAIQVYLIAGFIFGEAGWLDTHKDLGKAVHLCYILTFLFALVGAWPNWRATLWPFVLAALGSVQAFLAAGGDVGGSDAALHAFHGMLAPVVFVVALYVAWQAWLALQATPERPTAAV
jgi:Family of unknown function (DUF6220)